MDRALNASQLVYSRRDSLLSFSFVLILSKEGRDFLFTQIFLDFIYSQWRKRCTVKKTKMLAAEFAGADVVFQLPLQIHPLGNGSYNLLQPKQWMKNSQYKRNSYNIRINDVPEAKYFCIYYFTTSTSIYFIEHTVSKLTMQWLVCKTRMTTLLFDFFFFFAVLCTEPRT